MWSAWPKCNGLVRRDRQICKRLAVTAGQHRLASDGAGPRRKYVGGAAGIMDQEKTLAVIAAFLGLPNDAMVNSDIARKRRGHLNGRHGSCQKGKNRAVENRCHAMLSYFSSRQDSGSSAARSYHLATNLWARTAAQ